MKLNHIYQGDVINRLKDLPDRSIQCVVTSPPYWGLRNYQMEGQLGLEPTPELYVENMVQVFREVHRVLRDDGTLWLNLGDSYCGTGHKGDYKDPKHKEGRNGQSIAVNNKIKGLKQKDLVGIPWRVAFALQADGWYLRQDIIWHKPNPMPESVTDRCTKAHEYIFLLTKSAKYFYDNDAIREPYNTANETPRSEKFYGLRDRAVENGVKIQTALPQSRRYTHEGRNKRSVWRINTKPYKEAHFAVFPEELPTLCIKAGSSEGDVVLDPFFGSGTTGWVAQRLGRKWIGIELNAEYIKIAEKRFAQKELFQNA